MHAQRRGSTRSGFHFLGKAWLLGSMLSLTLSLPVVGQAQGQFVDPLDQPAAVTQAAHTKPLRALAQAGERLIAAGENGLIIYSDDQGVTWQQARVPVSVDINALHFSSKTLGWAAGHGGAILHSRDGGKSWEKQLDGRELADLVSDFYSQGRSGLTPEREEAYLSAIMAMTQPGPGQFFMGVWFDERGQQGYVVGPFGLFMASTDGGETWRPHNTHIDNDDLLHLTDIAQMGSTVAISGERGHVWVLDPATGRFSARDTGYNGTLFGITGNTDVLLAFGLRGHVFRSLDQGMTWQALDSRFETGVVAGTVLADGSMLLVSQSAQLARADAAAQALTSLPVERPSLLTDVVGISAERFALVGLNGFHTQRLR